VRRPAGLAAVALLAGACALGGCSSLGGQHPSPRPSSRPARVTQAGPFRPFTVPAPKALARLGITAGRGLRVTGQERFPLFPAAVLGAGLVVGLPAAAAPAGGAPGGGAPAFSPAGGLAGYAVVRLSDGRVTPLPVVHPGWDPGLAPRPVAATASRVIWLEADRRPGGYLWVLYAAPGPGSRPELLDGNREPVPAAGVPDFIGVQGNSACWARSDDARSWTIVRRPVTGPGPTITAQVPGTVTSCLPAGNDTIVVTKRSAGRERSAAKGTVPERSPAGGLIRAGSPAPGNVLDVTPEGRVGTLLSGTYAVSVQGQRVAYSSAGGGATSRTVSVARLAGHKLTGIRTLSVSGPGGSRPDGSGPGSAGPGSHSAALVMWLDSTHLLVGAGPDVAQNPLLLVDVRTGQTAPVLPGPSLLYWADVANGHLSYARSLPSPGPDRSLEIDEFSVRH
jgi:hypothetical protein